jgi:hypothetical protein
MAFLLKFPERQKRLLRYFARPFDLFKKTYFAFKSSRTFVRSKHNGSFGPQTVSNSVKPNTFSDSLRDLCDN